MRDVGVESALSALPGVIVVAFALLTQLGDIWFLATLVTLLYWLGPHTPRLGEAIDRRRAARVVAILLLSIAIVAVAKPLLALPRPPGAGVAPNAALVPGPLRGVYEWLSTGDGYGFPSGHALGSTLVYGGLAWAIRVGTRRRRAAFAAGMVVLLSVSRLVLGLHYLVDVLAGAALGLAVLALAIGRAETRQVFGLAAAIGVGGALLVSPSVEVLAAAGVAVGATAAWLRVGDRVRTAPSPASARATVGVGALVGLGMGGLGAVAHTIPPAVSLLSLIGGWLLVAMPLLGERVAKKRA